MKIKLIKGTDWEYILEGEMESGINIDRDHMEIKEMDECEKIYTLKFKHFSLLKPEQLRNILDENIGKCNSILDVVEFLNGLSKQLTLTNLSDEKLIGDFGEISFLYFLQENNIKWQDYFQKGNEKIDLIFPTRKFDIKTVVNNGHIHCSLEQIKNKNFFIVKISENLNGKNILELFESLKHHTEYIQILYDKYKNCSIGKVIEKKFIVESIFILPTSQIPNIKKLDGDYEIIKLDVELKIKIFDDNRENIIELINHLIN